MAAARGRWGAALAHLAKGQSLDGRRTAEAYAEVVFEQWAARSGHQWTLDFTVVQAQGVQFSPTRVQTPAE